MPATHTHKLDSTQPPTKTSHKKATSFCCSAWVSRCKTPKAERRWWRRQTGVDEHADELAEAPVAADEEEEHLKHHSHELVHPEHPARKDCEDQHREKTVRDETGEKGGHWAEQHLIPSGMALRASMKHHNANANSNIVTMRIC
eukprot:1163544-Rhodomonas_salina.1